MSDDECSLSRLEELERLLMFQQGQLMALLSLQVSLMCASDDYRRLMIIACQEAPEAAPPPDTPAGSGYETVINALADAAAAADAEAASRRH